MIKGYIIASHIVHKSLNKELAYFGNVLLHYTVLPWFHLLRIFEHVDSFSLTSTIRFGNEGQIFLTPTKCLEVSKTVESLYYFLVHNYSVMTYSAGRHQVLGKTL